MLLFVQILFVGTDADVADDLYAVLMAGECKGKVLTALILAHLCESSQWFSGNDREKKWPFSLQEPGLADDVDFFGNVTAGIRLAEA